ncbi:MAG: lysostaphin resistance A-like protein [Muricoprocola sp.]
MDQNSIYKISRVMGPVVVHFFIINMVNMVGLHEDAAFLTTLAAIVALPIFLFWYREDSKFETKRERKFRARDVFTIILLALCANLILTIVMNQLQVFFSLPNDSQERLFASNLATQVIGIGIIVPIMEEVLFRGLVYRRLKAYNDSWGSLLLAAVMFAVYHGNLVQMIFAFPMAVILIWCYRRWETLLAPVVFHITVNLSSVIIMAVFS